MSHQHDILFEIGSEELPPKALKALAEHLLVSVKTALEKAGIAFKQGQYFASPRRLAFLLNDVSDHQKDIVQDRWGPFIDQAFDHAGQPTPAALGFARSCGVDIDEIEKQDTDKGQRLFFQLKQAGQKSADLLPTIINQALKQLPVPKMMRWGDSDIQFARPVHWVVLMASTEVIDGEILGLKTGNISFGHRHHAPESIEIENARDYVHLLRDKGHVLVDWQARKTLIVDEIKKLAENKGANAVLDDALIEEVTAIVEWPYALCCQFDERFLRVPPEALISSMQEHQKCFALKDQAGKLINQFITICNIDSVRPQTVISGNQKVMTARLSDAAFFYDQDIKKPLEAYLPRLDQVTFQKKLGTMGQRARRIASLSRKIADHIGADLEMSFRAGLLAKADLMSDMVFEFADLQGIIGKYYARVHHEAKEIATAIEQQYWPKFSGDRLPDNGVSQAVSLADKMDLLVGIFGISQKPTGDRDPFALRRAAIGVLRILKEKALNVSLTHLIDAAIEGYDQSLADDTKSELKAFFIDRLRGLYKEEGLSNEVFESVLAVEHASVADFDQRITAVLAFIKLPVSQRLVESNKRVINILTKNATDNFNVIDPLLFEQDDERQLYEKLQQIDKEVVQLVDDCHYNEALVALSSLDEAISNFFDAVMVMAENEKVRLNRLALLQHSKVLFAKVADISKLATIS
ncbi:MAG: glycine--tRNA ligase subunit beta [Francisellaceae bacterium]